jgi:etoposide-induced 2.4 mRNA
MATLKVCLVQFVYGFTDSLYGCVKFIQKQKRLSASLAEEAAKNKPKTPRHDMLNLKAKSNEKLYKRLIQSCILNGVFLFLCICCFNYILMPVLNAVAFRLISVSNHDWIHNYINPFIQILFSSVWIMPVFFLSKVFNVLCHQEIADIAYEQKHGKPKIYKKFSFSEVIADTVFSCTMQLVFLVQSSCMGLIPATWLNNVVCHVHTSFLYSLYAFEYKLCNMGWDIETRIHHIESRWPYYLGFGLSMSLILSYAGSYIYSATLFGFIFPAFILASIESDSENLPRVMYLKQDFNAASGYTEHELTVPLFKFSIYATDFLFKVFSSRRMAQSKPLAQPQQQAFTIRKTN